MEDGIFVIIVGLVLCFYGVGSIHLVLLASGFGASWLLAEIFGAGWALALLVGLIGALVTWVVVKLMFGAVMFVLGAVVGAVTGARLYGLLERGDTSWLLAGVVVVSVSIAAGFLAVRFREPFLVWATAIGGAAMALNGLARAVRDFDELHSPDTALEVTVATASWIALAIAGALVQRNIFVKND